LCAYSKERSLLELIHTYQSYSSFLNLNSKSKMSNEQDLKAKALALLPGFKTELGEELTTSVPDKQLLKFLHWKPDINRAAERFRAHVQWRNDNGWAFDNPHLLVSTDKQLKKLTKSQFFIAPESMVSKGGAAVIVGRLRKNDMKDGRTPTEVCRAILYTIDRVLEREEAQMNGIVIFHDLNGLSKNNIHPLIPKMLTAIIGNFPIKISGLYLLNPPLVFRVFFTPIIRILFPKKLKERTHYVDSIDDVYNIIDKAKLLKEHGGELDFDPDTEVARHEENEENDNFGSLHSCIA